MYVYAYIVAKKAQIRVFVLLDLLSGIFIDYFIVFEINPIYGGADRVLSTLPTVGRIKR